MAADMQILVVDDSETSQRRLLDALVAGGYKAVHFCHSGNEALAHLGVEPVNQCPELPGPDAILMDIVMAGLDGIETCARIRADARYRYTPILMVTAESDVGTLAQAFIAGANDYMRKPFEQLELLARLRAALRLKSEIDRRIQRERELRSACPDTSCHLRVLSKHTPDAARKRFAAFAPYDGVLDPLTGLPGRRTVEAMIMDRASAPSSTLGVLALQIDGLPPSSAGEESEDYELLTQVADALKTLPGRLGDVLARFEGGVFIAISNEPETGALTARANALCAMIANLDLRHRAGRGGGHATISAGVAHAAGGAPVQARALLSAAVAAMEQASSSGGNRVETAPPQTPVQLAANAR